MKQYGTNYQMDVTNQDMLISIKDPNHIINELSNLTFYNNLNKLSLSNFNTYFADIKQFISSAEGFLNSRHGNNSYTIIVFDINKFSDINKVHGSSVGDSLLKHIDLILKSHIHDPYLYCRIDEENFAVFLENYKDIDIALLAIYLSEEISIINKEIKPKLSFGICKAKTPDLNITSLYNRAFYAKSTITKNDRKLLANYNEIVFN